MKIVTSKWKDLFLSNFLGVFNDNLLKNAIIFIAVGWKLPGWMNQSQLISIVSASLVLPYLIFSPFGGKLAVKYLKQSVFRIFKLIEIPVMIFACFAFYFEWIYFAIIAVLLMGILSSMYSPSKYGLIRDIGGEQGVSEGSGGFEAMAFLGILLGTFVASLLSDVKNDVLIYTLFVGVAVLGYFVTRQIKVEELQSDAGGVHRLNPVTFFRHTYRVASDYPLVNVAVLGAAVFWLIGSVLQMNLVIHAGKYYAMSDTWTGVVMGVAAVGIALGTWVAGKISGEHAEKGLILIGLAGMFLVLCIILLVNISFFVFVILILLFAFCGGLFQVPNLSIIQASDLGRNLGAVIAYLNLLTFILILLGTFLFSVTTSLTNENSFAVFGVLALICFAFLIFFIFRSDGFLRSSRLLMQRLWTSNGNIK